MTSLVAGLISHVSWTAEIMQRQNQIYLVVIILPALIIFVSFFILPMIRLALETLQGPQGFGVYLTMLTTVRYLKTLFYTVALSLSVTIVTLVISGICGVFLQRTIFLEKIF